EYIPLETNEEFITVGYVQAINKDFIIVRNTNHVGTGNIFIFDRNGKALRKINRRGQSNEEYTNIAGLITLDEDNR
ncbi:MAG: 6-bladed beta-propeller, partial [Tannerellaceae bacterium]|nr:6-bladed beta-propeller [Tannerellaceae bacterium]